MCAMADLNHEESVHLYEKAARQLGEYECTGVVD